MPQFMCGGIGTGCHDVVAGGSRLAGTVQQAGRPQHVNRNIATQVDVTEIVRTRLCRATQSRTDSRNSLVVGHRDVSPVLQIQVVGVRSRRGKTEIKCRKIFLQPRLDRRPFRRRVDVLCQGIGVAVKIQSDDLLLKSPQQVVAAAAIQLVQAVTTDQGVAASLALEIVIAQVAEQRVATSPAQQRVVTGDRSTVVVITVDEIVSPVTVEPVITTVAQDRVVVPVSIDRVGVGSTFHVVMAGPAMNHVHPGLTVQFVVTTFAVDPVVTHSATQRIVAVTSGDRIARPHQFVSAGHQVMTVSSIDRVSPIHSVDHVVSVTTVDHVPGRSTVDRVVAITGIDGRRAGSHRDHVLSITCVNDIGEVDGARDCVVAVASLDRDTAQAREHSSVHATQPLCVAQIDRVSRIATLHQDRLNGVGIERTDTGIGNVIDRASQRSPDQDLNPTRHELVFTDHDRIVCVRDDRQVTVEEQRRDRQQCPVLEYFSNSRTRGCPVASPTRKGMTSTATRVPRTLPASCQAVDPRCNSHGSHSKGP